MSGAASDNGGSRRSVADVVADWRSKCARGEPVDAEALLAEIDAAAHVLPTIVLGQAIPAQAETPTVSLHQPPSSRMRAAASAAASRAGGLDDYDVLREIAHGGMGIVYEARQRSLNRIVALKMIRSGALADEEGVARFYAEAEAAANLRHPNIVAVYEVGRADAAGQHYFTMDYVAGPSLLELIRKQPLEARRAAVLVAKVARAIQFAHERGVLHRDLKPSNILIGEDGEPRVTDFGLAKRIDHDSQLTIAGAVVGTPNYMPPEQARGEHERVGPRSDVYSLGAVLYECLTGRPPLVAARLADILALVINEEPLPPSRLSPKVPRDLETICLKCLEKEPSRRYAAAGDLADDLERFLQDEPIRARPVGFVERGLKFARRKPAWAGLGLISVLAALVVAAIVGVYTGKLATSNAKLTKSVADEKEQRGLAVERYDSLRNSTYATLVQKTEDYWTDDPPNLAGARELLARLVPGKGEADLRGFEWHFLHRLCHNDEQRFATGGGPFDDLVVRDDGRLIAVGGSGEKWLAVFRGSERERLTRLKTGDAARRIVVSRRGPWAVVVGLGGVVQLRGWETLDRVEAEIGHTGERFSPVAIADDGSLIAYATDERPLNLWSVGERRLIGEYLEPIADLREMGFSPDAARVFLRGSSVTWVVELASKVGVSFTTSRKTKIAGAAFSPDSSRLALTFEDGNVDVHDLANPKMKVQSFNLLRFFVYPRSIAFLPDGEHVALGSANSLVVVVDLKKRAPPRVYRGHQRGVAHLAVAADGQTLYSGSLDGEGLAWDLSVEDQRAHVFTEMAASGWPLVFGSLAYSPDGKWLACGAKELLNEAGDAEAGKLLVLDAVTREIKHRLDSPRAIATCSFSPDSKLLAYGIGELAPASFYAWDVAEGRPLGELKLDGSDLNAACFAAGNRLVLAGADGKLRVGLPGSTPREAWSPTATARAEPSPQFDQLVASADGRLIFSRNNGHVLRLWDAERGVERMRSVGHVGHMALALSARGDVAAWTTPEAATMESSTKRGLPPSPETQIAGEIAPHHQAIVFDLHQRKIRFIVGGHASPIYALALSADGSRLASGDTSGILKLWDTATGSELLSMEAHLNGVHAIAFHPGGRQLASIGSDAAVRIWWGEQVSGARSKE